MAVWIPLKPCNRGSFQNVYQTYLCFLAWVGDLLTLFVKEYTIRRAMENKFYDNSHMFYYYFSSLSQLPIKDLCKL